MARIDFPLRPAAVALGTGGLLLAAALPWHPSIFDRPVAEVVAGSPLWTLIHAVGILALAFAVFGAAGIVAAHGAGCAGSARSDSLVGALGAMGLVGLETLAFPVLAEHAPDLLALQGPLILSWQFGVAQLWWAVLLWRSRGVS